MFSKKILIAIVLLVVVGISLLYLFRPQTQKNLNETAESINKQSLLPSSSSTPLADSYNKKIIINDNEINVEEADTNESRRQGLSGRKSMPQDAGMLFIFDKADYYSFWMPDTYFPLDFIWINGDTIVDITENVPNQPGSDTQGLPRYKPSQPADKILELNAGKVKSLDIKIGDKIRYE